VLILRSIRKILGVSPALALRGRAIRYKSSLATQVAGFPLLSLTRKQIHIHAKNPTSQTNYGDF